MDTLADLIKDNASENAHLRKLVDQLSDADLRLPMQAGWTVAAVLGHMAFWDQRAITLIAKWQKEGVGPSAVDTDVVNEATRPPVPGHRAALAPPNCPCGWPVKSTSSSPA